MNYKVSIFGIVSIIMLFGCRNKEWEEHYDSPLATINTPVWEALQNDSDLDSFVNRVKEFGLDSLFSDTLSLRNFTYSIFAPSNEAFNQLPDTFKVTSDLIGYHISNFYIQTGNIKGKRKVETLFKKFALFNNSNSNARYDDIPLEFESPLYLNGKYFKMKQIARPRPNLYEYIASTNVVLKNYIDSQDSSILDREKSRPINFDEEGNTIYDTVSIEYNRFEDEFFPVSKESRYYTATLVFPSEDDYNNALTEIAQSLGGSFMDYRDIPMAYQNKILIPYLLEHGVFENMVEPIEFTFKTSGDTIKMKNIRGDSIVIDYQPSDKTLCSNGYAYNYTNFVVPDTLFDSPVRYEAEYLLDDIGIDKYAWFENIVKVTSDVSFSPVQEYQPAASNDSIVKVGFDKLYTGAFTLEFNIENLFPRKYRMVLRTSTNIGGLYNIYVNDLLVKTFDYYYYDQNKDIYVGVNKQKYVTKNGLNIFDCWVDNITEYGKANIKIEYTGPGKPLFSFWKLDSGFSLDYIEFIPF